MTTLAANQVRTMEIGDHSDIPVVASDIIYQGAAVGAVIASGHGRPLTKVDKFVGFAQYKADNSSGAAAAIDCRVVKTGKIVLPITGAVITDIQQPVYATDDNTFTFLKEDGVFIGIMTRFVSAGYGVVSFDAGVMKDPNEGLTAETVSADKTLDEEDSGKLIQVDTDGKVITLPAVEGMAGIRIANGGAYGTCIVKVASNANDSIAGPDLTPSDNSSVINTKTTANRGDYIDIEYGDGDGWVVTAMKGTWVIGAT